MKKLITMVLAFTCFLGFSSSCYAQQDASTYKTTNEKGMNEVYEFIKNCKTYYIATVDGDQPRVRPFGTVNIFDGKLYIQTGRKKRVAKQLAQNPKAEICALNGSTWIRLSGELIPDERVEAKKSMLDANPSLRSMYSETDENTVVYYFRNATAYISSFTGEDRKIEF